jgi:hypothetical protein
MKEDSNKLYDETEVNNIREKLATEISSGNNTWQNNAVQYLLSVLEEALDENESLWFMLDEEKNSKATSEHTKLLNDLIQNRITYLKMIQNRRGEA